MLAIASDPSDAVTLPRLRRAEAAMTLPTNDQVAGILAAADERFRALVALAAFAELRLGEAGDLLAEVLPLHVEAECGTRRFARTADLRRCLEKAF